jgi:hypothetical protein
MLLAREITQVSAMEDNEPTSVAVLGTLAEFHNEAIPFDMSALLDLVAEINPDLLLLDMAPEHWRKQEFSELPPEYREALVPLAHQTDIVVAPIGDELTSTEPEIGGWRGKAIGWLRKWIAAIQRAAPGPDAVNQGWRHSLANYLCLTTRLLSSAETQLRAQDHIDYLTRQVLEVSRRDPGARALVVVNVRHCHIIRERLREYDDISVATYSEL